jgi:phosphoglucosamine mutase
VSETRLFGTDGLRAPFGAPPLDRPTVTALAAALAAELRATSAGPTVVLGGDTRESTPTICGWLADGLAAGGATVRSLGVIPTPGVAHLTRRLGAAAGISVSASHNPWPDNGIKLIDPRGFKWPEEGERRLERQLAQDLASGDAAVPERPLLPLPPLDEGLRDEYLAHLASTVPGERPLDGLAVVLDAGNGAASAWAAPLFERLGARVTLLHAAPDGRNVNAGCGSTAPEEMAARVVATGAALGAAFDGDADRCILADDHGTVRDGDAILYLWATGLHRAGRLHPARIVATSMSNLGLERALAREGIELVRCDVGDRWVVEMLQSEGLRLGGEQSGHIVDLALASTGDGLLTALQVAHLVHRAGRPFSELLAGFRRYPQILQNVRVRQKKDFAGLPKVQSAAREVERRLGADGRLVLRYSGTEPLARIMIEGPDQPTIEALAGDLAEALAADLG